MSNKTEWANTRGWDPLDPPPLQRAKEPHSVFTFVCPFCKKRRQITGPTEIICGLVRCGCQSKLRIVKDVNACPQCCFKTRCLAVGITRIIKEVRVPDTAPYSHLRSVAYSIYTIYQYMQEQI